MNLSVACFVKRRTVISKSPLSKVNRNMSEKHDFSISFCSSVTKFGRTEPQKNLRFDFNPQSFQIRWWAMELTTFEAYPRSDEGRHPGVFGGSWIIPMLSSFPTFACQELKKGGPIYV